MPDELRLEVCALHADLPRNGLVAWTSGNLSARVPGEELMVIKPSGVRYEELTPAAIVVCDLDGDLVEGEYAPSSDAATHGHIYRALPEVGGVVHTHSPYATAWAIHGERIPCVMTAMADEFGGEIPVGPFALIGDEVIGRGVVETLTGQTLAGRALMRAHGVFAVALDRARRSRRRLCGARTPPAPRISPARRARSFRSSRREHHDPPHHRYQNVYSEALRRGGPGRQPPRAITTAARVSACWGSCRASTTTCSRASPTARRRTPPRWPAALADIADVTVSAPVKEREDAEREIAALRDVDGLLVVMLTYGPAMRVARLLAETPLPICLANIQPVPEVTPAWDMGDLTYNQGIHGAQDTANAIAPRAGRPFHVVTGDWRSDEFRRRSAGGRRGRGVHPLAGAQGRRVGYPMNGMGDTRVDSTRSCGRSARRSTRRARRLHRSCDRGG